MECKLERMEGLNSKNGKINQKWLSKHGLMEVDKMRPNWSLRRRFFLILKKGVRAPT